MEKVLNVAQYIFTKYKSMTHKNIDELKLHKLLYLSQRESLAVVGEPMFLENFEGWKFGPVCREVRNVFTKKKGLIIQEFQDISDENKYIVNNILSQYGGYESWKLSELSHNEISWSNARKNIPLNHNGNKILSISDIKKDAEKVRPYDSLWDMYYDEFEDFTLEL